jgi:hypothetical protein
MAMSPRLALRSALLVAAFLLVVMLIPHAPQPARERPSIDKLFRLGRTPEPWVDLATVPWTTHDGGEWAGAQRSARACVEERRPAEKRYTRG